jgi:hypothetical protein
MEPKDKKIIAEAERDNIPIFVLVAKDELSLLSIQSYLGMCIHSGCKQDHINAIRQRIKEFEDWQIKNPDKVKLPD